jgi:hypothetical protein
MGASLNSQGTVLSTEGAPDYSLGCSEAEPQGSIKPKFRN